MNRWAWLTICSVAATALLVCGLLVPSHLRAVDARVLSRAGQGTPALVQTGLDLTRQQQLGVANFYNFHTKPVYITEWNRRVEDPNNSGDEAASALFLSGAFEDLDAWNRSPPRNVSRRCMCGSSSSTRCA